MLEKGQVNFIKQNIEIIYFINVKVRNIIVKERILLKVFTFGIAHDILAPMTKASVHRVSFCILMSFVLNEKILPEDHLTQETTLTK